MELRPLFDRSSQHVGWLAPGQYIFDTSMKYLVYIADDNAWTSTSREWCGPVRGTACIDKKGRVVAWGSPEEDTKEKFDSPIRPVRAGLAPRPGRPPRPPRPARTIRPPTPPGGWSFLSFREWSGQDRQDEY